MRSHTLLLIPMITFSFLPMKKNYSQNLEKREVLTRLSNELKLRMEADRAAAVAQAQQHNFPVRTITSEGVVVELQGLLNGRPLYYTTHNVKAAETIKTDKVWKNGALGYTLTGATQELGMWEGGAVRSDHYEFGGRVSQGDGSSAITDHATHTAGTLIAAGVVDKAKGMVYEATLRAYDWTSDLAEMAGAAAEGMTLSNHSYGPHAGWLYDLFGDNQWAWCGDPNISETEDYQFGYYLDRARQWDDLVYQVPEYLVVASAGNDRSELGPISGVDHWVYDGSSWELSTVDRERDGGQDGFDSINGFALAKNVLTVGAVQPFQNGYTSPEDVLMTHFSCWGPTDDGRIKPDIVADGVSIYSTSMYGPDVYAVRNGTSSATPSVTGSVALLREHYGALFDGASMLASTLKGLIIHTATEAGPDPGPDYQFGWGLMNTARAVDLISMDEAAGGDTFVRERTLQDGGILEFQVEVNGQEPLKATLCWTDPAGPELEPALNSDDLVLVNDLDLRVVGPLGAEHSPWILDPDNPSFAAAVGDNIRDNVEQVVVENPTAGTYTVRISHKGSLQDGNQTASLVLTGIFIPTIALPDPPVLENPESGSILDTDEVLLQWQSVGNATSYTLQVSHDSDFTDLYLEEEGIRVNSYSLRGLAQNMNFYWRVSAKNPGGMSSASEQRTFSTSEGAVPVVWQKISPPELDYFVRGIVVNQRGHIFASLEVPSTVPDFLDIEGTYRSVDNGETWERISYPYWKLAINSQGNIFSIDYSDIYDLGIDGEQMEWVYTYPGRDGKDVIIDEGDVIYALYEDGQIVYSSDDGNQWNEFGQVPIQGSAITQTFSWIQNSLCVATWGEGVYCTGDSAQTWQQITEGSGISYVYTVEGSEDGKYLLGTSGGLFMSPMDTLNWQQAQNGVIEYAKISTIVVKDCGVIYAGNYGCHGIGYGVFVSVDHGDTWLSVNEGLNHQSARFLHESPQGTLFAGIGTGDPTEGGAIYRGSHEKAMEYVGRELGLTAPGSVSLVSPGDGSDQIQAGVVLRWEAVSNACAYQVQVSTNPDFLLNCYDEEVLTTETSLGLLAGETTHYWRVRAIDAIGRGPWSEVWEFTTAPGTGVEKIELIIPRVFSLYPNYPNPFNPGTTITFDIPEKSFVILKVYNLSGQEVATLFSREVEPGCYKSFWDGRGFPSGMYIAQIRAGSFKASQKLLLQK